MPHGFAPGAVSYHDQNLAVPGMPRCAAHKIRIDVGIVAIAANIIV